MKKEKTFYFAETMENTLKFLFLHNSHFYSNLVLGVFISNILINTCYW